MKRKPWSKGQTAEQNARSVLPHLVQDFFAAGRKAAKEKRLGALHKFRLEVKHFRYTVEAFQPIYGPELDARLAALRKIQQLLGSLNDCVTTEELLKDYDGAASVIKLTQSRAKTKARKFRKYWNEQFGTEAAEQEWLNSFSGGATEQSSTGPAVD